MTETINQIVICEQKPAKLVIPPLKRGLGGFNHDDFVILRKIIYKFIILSNNPNTVLPF